MEKNPNFRYQSFQEFWPFYLSQHRNLTCRRLHYVGTLLGSTCFVLGALWAPKWILGGLIMGYAFAWIGHFVFEKNRPATFTYPIWSFLADYKMLYYFLTGQLDSEFDRVVSANS